MRITIVIHLLFLLLVPVWGETLDDKGSPTNSTVTGRILLRDDRICIERSGQPDVVLKIASSLPTQRVSGFLRAAGEQPLQCLVMGDEVCDVRLPDDGHLTFRCQHCACRMSMKAASEWEEPCKACKCGKTNGSCYGDYR